jgi:electron transfer flavoprotein beta subunit
MKAKKKPLAAKKLGDLGLDPSQAGEAGSKIKILGLTPPPERKSGQMVSGETNRACPPSPAWFASGP